MWLCFISTFLFAFTRSEAITVSNLDAEIGPVAHVSFLYRHGERAPDWIAKVDSSDIEKYWSIGLGQLTKKGMLHHYKIGQWLKKRYISLIPGGDFSVRTMCTNSTDYDRTLMSAQVNLAGMFPPKENRKFADLAWSPIPVYSTQLALDKFISMEKVKCLAYSMEEKNLRATSSFKKLNAKSEELFFYLTKILGELISRNDDLQDIYSTLSIYESNGYPLPEWSKTVYPGPLKEAADFAFRIPTFTTLMKRLRTGPLLKTIVKTFKEKIDDDAVRRVRCSNITAYSAHDTTIASFLNTLGIFNGIAPPFASFVMVELRKSVQNQFFVNVLYKNSTDPFADPYLLPIPYCGDACPFENFVKLYTPLIPENWDKECYTLRNVNN